MACWATADEGPPAPPPSQDGSEPNSRDSAPRYVAICCAPTCGDNVCSKRFPTQEQKNFRSCCP